ncbi:MAG: ABC transporter ATP-binding protein [Alphaproteobacteria bacterium]|nr:ABC transporter ATP-binding protein [Alphaproteobacteria bacterium]
MIAFEEARAAYGLNGIDAALRAGKVTGIVGPNGAGKTSLLRAALGLLPLTGGAVLIQDRSASGWSRETLARTIAYLPQGGEAHWPLPARELVALGRLPHRDRDARAIDAALERADATAFATRSTHELSAGERARVLLARALATGAPALLADEPAAYLDPAHQLRLMQLLRDEAGRGAAVAVTLHDLALASRHCDEIVVLDGGRVAAHDLSDRTLSKVFGIEALRVEGAVVPWRVT